MKTARDELIRIDAQGVAHPIGTVASQRMRPHRGCYRLLPGPEHVVFMRYTGEDGVIDAEDGSLVRLAGEITSPGAICGDVLALVAQTSWSGVLSVHEGNDTRRVFVDQASVVGVQTNVHDEWLGPVMYRYGLLQEDDLRRVEAELGAGRRFGEVALDLGVVQKEDIYRTIRLQIEEVVFATMRVVDGTFFFLDGMDPTELPARLAVNMNTLLMDGVTRMDESKYFEEKIPTSNHVPARAEGREVPEEKFRELWEQIDGHASVQELGRSTGLGEFETTKALFSLVQSKHVVVHPPRMSGGPAAIVSAANDVLAAVFRAARDHGSEAELRGSLSSFTTGAGVFYELLFRGAGPAENGHLDPERVADNAVLVAQGEDTEQAVRKLLYDYVSFALFSIGSAIGKEGEAELQRSVGATLEQLRPRS